MVAAMDAELTRGVWIGARFDVLDVSPIDSNRYIVLGLACHGTSMASDASLVVDYKSVVHH